MIAIVFDYRMQNQVDFLKLNKSLRRNLLIAMKVFGNKAERKLRKIIRSGKYEANSPPWAAAKGSNKPLYDTGHLSTTIRNKVLPGVGDVFVSVKVGWLDNKPHPERPGSKGGMQDIVGFLTTERKWEPSKSSSDAFWAKVPAEWKRANPPLFKPQWESPARDFIKDAVYDVDIQSSFILYINKATNRAIKGK